MKNYKYVSVIVPTYNRAHFIVEAIESVLAQDVIDDYLVEILVIDDGSTDTTEEKLKKFGNKIIYKKIDHTGKPAVFRNYGISVARGELIAFLDSDDLWSKDKLRKQIPYFNNPSVVMTYGNASIIDNDGNSGARKVVVREKLKNGENFAKLLADNVIPNLTVAVRKSALLSVGGFDESPNLAVGEDYELWLRIAAKYPNGIKCITSDLAYYRLHSSNISSADDITAVERILKVFEILWDKKITSDEQNSHLEKAIFAMNKSWVYLKTHGSDNDIQPAVSVIMSVYNAADHLKASVQSILDQTFNNLEFIIIDDGSEDGSLDILKKFKDNRLRIIRQRNHGLVFSLNKGIEISRGDYIARQDADDISLTERLKKEIELLEKDQKVGIVGTFFTYIDEATKTPSLTISMPTKSIDIKRALYVTNPFGHGTVIIRKSVFKNTGLYTDEYGPVEDYELWRRIADKWELAIIPEPLYHYLLNKKGVSHTKAADQQISVAKIISEQWAKPFYSKSIRNIVRDGFYYRGADSPYASSMFERYSDHQIDITKALLERGSIFQAVRSLLGAIILRPKSFKLYLKPAARGIIRDIRTLF